MYSNKEYVKLKIDHIKLWKINKYIFQTNKSFNNYVFEITTEKINVKKIQ